MSGNSEMKRRMKSVRDLRQMTRAMQLISQIKRQQATKLLNASKPFFVHTMRTMNEIIVQTPEFFDPLFNLREKAEGSSWKILIYLIPAEGGMAGAYTMKVLRRGEQLADDLRKKWFQKAYRPQIRFRILGKKVSSRLEDDGYDIEAYVQRTAKGPDYYMAQDFCERLFEEYQEESFDELYFVYMHMNNAVNSEPLYIRMLPADPLGLQLLTRKLLSESELEEEEDFIQTLSHRRLSFEPNADEVTKYLEYNYMTALLFGILNEAYASEQTWRMQAMDSATNNADELLEDMQQKMNQARQQEITEELNEIIAGASSL